MKFFLIIEKNTLCIYENNNGKYEKQFIEGNDHYPYDLEQVQEDIGSFLDILADEKNLGTKAKLSFDVLENENQIRTNGVMEVLGPYTEERYRLNDTVMKILRKLSKDKKLHIQDYGINYDGICYKIHDSRLLTGPFDLLAYTVHGDDIVELL